MWGTLEHSQLEVQRNIIFVDQPRCDELAMAAMTSSRTALWLMRDKSFSTVSGLLFAWSERWRTSCIDGERGVYLGSPLPAATVGAKWVPARTIVCSATRAGHVDISATLRMTSKVVGITKRHTGVGCTMERCLPGVLPASAHPLLSWYDHPVNIVQTEGSRRLQLKLVIGYCHHSL